jgi:uncharacterized membrane protein
LNPFIRVETGTQQAAATAWFSIRLGTQEALMYIGLGTVVLIVIIVLVILMLRRR